MKTEIIRLPKSKSKIKSYHSNSLKNSPKNRPKNVSLCYCNVVISKFNFNFAYKFYL